MLKITEVLLKVFATKLLSETYESTKKYLRSKKSVFKVSLVDIETALKDHADFVNEWSKQISFRELAKSKVTVNVFIQLDFYLNSKRYHPFPKIDDLVNLKKVFQRETKNIIILGQPGAGKTTSMKFIAQLIFFDEKFCPDKFTFPILIRLRDLNKESSIIDSRSGEMIFDYLFRVLQLKMYFREKSEHESELSYQDGVKWVKINSIIKLLDPLQVLIIIEGFDEVIDETKRNTLLEEIRYLTLNLKYSRLVVTSRTGEFPYHIENSSVYEIAPLSDMQIERFAYKWLGKKKNPEKLINQLKKSPFYDTTIRPLTLAHLCAIYEKYKKIPEKPKTVYKIIVELLLKEWDLQRQVKRISKYGQFEVDRKFEFLSNLAFQMTTSFQKTVFSKKTLTDIYLLICKNYSLPKKEVREVVDELESHNGLFLQTGVDQYEFAHKSIQEYLTAEYISRLPTIPQDINLITKLPHEMALAVAISSNPTLYFNTLIMESIGKKTISPIFISIFFKRILLEKPDFAEQVLLGFSFVYMFTYYVKNLSSLNHDDIDVFTDLSKEKEIRSSLKQLINNEYYKIVNANYKHHKITQELMKLKKVKELQDPLINSQLPGELIIAKNHYYDD